MRTYKKYKIVITIFTDDILTDSTETNKTGEYEKFITDIWAE